MNPDLTGLLSILATDGVAVGTTPVVVGGATRAVVMIANPSGVDVFLKFAPRGGAAPTVSATNWHYLVSAGDHSPFLGLNDAIDVYAWSASATTVNVIEGGY
ncbi:MAG: hypothetical protein ACO1SV_00745 [Fimbriimonas sp.]